MASYAENVSIWWRHHEISYVELQIFLFAAWDKILSTPFMFQFSHTTALEPQTLIRIDGLMQERRNSSALATELRLSCINPSVYNTHIGKRRRVPLLTVTMKWIYNTKLFRRLVRYARISVQKMHTTFSGAEFTQWSFNLCALRHHRMSVNYAPLREGYITSVSGIVTRWQTLMIIAYLCRNENKPRHQTIKSLGRWWRTIP